MKRIFLLFALTMCFFLNSRAQKDEQKPHAPKEDIKVNREYDDKGNLIKFDSIYCYSLSGDTTLLNSILPKNFPDLFGGQFGNFSDSTFFGDSFFGGSDPSFSPFDQKQDSILMKKFGMDHHFQNFNFRNDSLSMSLKDFDEFFNNFSNSQQDSISSKSHKEKSRGTQQNSMDDLFKMLQDQMLQMEKQQRDFFKQSPKLKEL